MLKVLEQVGHALRAARQLRCFAHPPLRWNGANPGGSRQAMLNESRAGYV
jgi:hypothetical protein